MRAGICEFWKDESGMGTVEIILIIPGDENLQEDHFGKQPDHREQREQGDGPFVSGTVSETGKLRHALKKKQKRYV